MSKIKCSVTQILDNKQPKVNSSVTILKPISEENDTMAKMKINFTETDARKIKNLIGKDLKLTDIVEVSFKVTEEQLTLDDPALDPEDD